MDTQPAADQNHDSLDHLLDDLAAQGKDVGQELSRLANYSYNEYETTGNKAEIDTAITCAKLAVQRTPEGDSNLAWRSNELGNMLESRYERTTEIEDLEEAIQVAELAVTLTPDNHLDRPPFLSNLGNKLARRYDRTQETQDLEEAIRVDELAVESTPEGHPYRAGILQNLGTCLVRRYQRTQELQDLEGAIRVAERAVGSNPEDHQDLAGILQNLRTYLVYRFDQNQEIQDLEEASRVAEQAMKLAPDDHLDRAVFLSKLGNKLSRRYEQTQEIRDLEEAIRVAEQAVELTPEDHPDRALLLSNLGIKLGRRYDRTEETEHLDKAIRVIEQAVQSAAQCDPDRVPRLNDLGVMLQSRYQRIGEIKDLDKAITTAQQAVQLTPESHANRAAYLGNLGNYLDDRYQRMSQMQDLDESIRVAELAVKSAPEGHPDRVGCLSNLGNKLGRRYDRTEEMQDLQEAIRAAEEAVKSATEDHPDRPTLLNNLGDKFGRRYQRIGEIRDLEEAIRVVELAVQSTPADDPRRAARLHNLGMMLAGRCQYHWMRHMKDLEEAILIAEQAVQSAPADHPDRAVMLKTLGSMLGQLYERTGDMRDLEKACSYSLEAWRYRAATPFHRISAAAQGLKLLAAQKNFQKAVDLARNVLDILPIVSSRFLDRRDRQYVISMFSGIAADGCALLLQAQRPIDALRYLEEGRAVILSQLMDDRRDISKLKEQNMELACTYDRLRIEVNRTLGDLDYSKRTSTLNRRRAAVEELDSCIQAIRRLPGYDRFLLGQTTAEMQACAVEGSIVIINVTEIRSDAIIVSSSAIKTLMLSKLTASRVKSWIGKKWTGGRAERGKRNREYLEYLSWLWDACVKLVLEEIGTKTKSPKETLPRIWWIGTGLASSIPFHAAGKHSPGSTENVYHSVISSYTPSIRALAHSRDRMKCQTSMENGLLIATMKTTPGYKDLPGVTMERDRALRATTGLVATEPLDQPSVDEVLKSLRRCSIAHFACHGYTDHVDPSNSGLVFQKKEGCELPQQDILTVHKVFEVNSKQARIAYLSACSTAENRVAQLADEVIHVVSGFQVAGYAHVIGCLWPSGDGICADVAEGFYSSLFRHGGESWGSREVAMALRDAIIGVKASNFKQPLTWAPFVHYGA